jgi:outer membrane receptor for ferrienterochelin and colicins
MRARPSSRSLPAPWTPFVLLALLALPASVAAQATGTLTGVVVRADDGSPLAGVTVSIPGASLATVTNPKGQYTLHRVPAGTHTVVFRWLGFIPVEVSATVAQGGAATADARLEARPVSLADVVVVGASRAPERVAQAPAEISAVDPRALQTASITGQAPLVLRDVPGVDLTQSGMYDFNVNSRGFNSSLTRRVLVLQDGRDLSVAFLGSQEWAALTIPAEDFAKVEFVSGPGSALYGANAYNGVLDLSSPTARTTAGTKITVGGGNLSSFKGDLRHAGVLQEGRFGYRFNAGITSSDTWSRSRTRTDGTSLRQEYREATDSAVPINRELRPLEGQTTGSDGTPLGDRDPIRNVYGTGRLDYYASNGSILTVEGGAAHTQNEVFVTGIGRVQATGVFRPWARVALANPGYNVMAYWNGRNTLDPQWSLGANIPLEEESNIFHVEGQGNHVFGNDRGRVVYGGSVRNIRVNTKTTLILPQFDDRSDYYYAGFGQFSWDISLITRLVVAARMDLGTLIDPQFSPKAALVVTPNDMHSVRFTVNRAFQTPNYSEFFLRVPAGPPANFLALEAGLRASALGPALAGVPQGKLFDNSAAVPVWARGNGKLDVEKTTGFEVGYRGDWSRRLYVTLDGFYNLLSNFVTDLLPGVNPAFPRWTAPAAVPASARAPLEAAVRNALLANPASRTAGLGLTRTEDGRTGIVVSYANAGEAEMWGANLGVGLQLADEVRADGYLSWFDYKVDQAQTAVGDRLLANTPEWRSRLGLSYVGRQGFDARLAVRTSSGFPWAAGVFVGWIEPAAIFDLEAGYRVNNNVKVFASGTNIFDKQWFSIYGGSVNGARVMAGVTTIF